MEINDKQLEVLNGQITGIFEQLKNTRKEFSEMLDSMTEQDALEILKGMAANQPDFKLKNGDSRFIFNKKYVCNCKISGIDKTYVKFWQEDFVKEFEFTNEEVDFYSKDKQYFDLYRQLQDTSKIILQYLSK